MARVEASSPKQSKHRTSRKTCPGTRSASPQIHSNNIRAICRELGDEEGVSYAQVKRIIALLDAIVKRSRQKGYGKVGIPKKHSSSWEHALIRRILNKETARAIVERLLLGAKERGLRYIAHKGKNGRYHGAIAVVI